MTPRLAPSTTYTCKFPPENRNALALDNDAAVDCEAASAERWLVENRHALDSSNAFVEEHGLPLPRRDKPLTP